MNMLTAICSTAIAAGNSDARSLHVLHAISSLDPRDGGTTIALQGLALAQMRAGLDLTTIATHRAGFDSAVINTLRAAGARVRTIGPATGRLARHPELPNIIEQAVRSANLVHIHALWEDIQALTAQAALRMGVPYIITPHGMLDPWSLRQRRWLKRAYLALRLRRLLDGAVALHFTAAAESRLVKPLGLRPPHLVIPNGTTLDLPADADDRGAFRRHIGVENDTPLIVFLGRLHPKKGVDLLLEGFAIALREWPSQRVLPHLAIIGPGPEDYSESLRQTARQLNIHERTTFTGALFGQDKAKALQDADLLALISHQENFGLVVAEALAAGVPVLISDAVNICDTVDAHNVGWVVPTSSAATGSALLRWAKCPSEELTAMSQRARRAAQDFDWDKIAIRWHAVYESLAAKETPKAAHQETVATS